MKTDNRLRSIVLAVICTCVSSCASTAASPREASITFDDLPFISVTHLDPKARAAIARKLVDSIGSNNVPAVGFVNEYGLYGYERDSTGEPDPGSVALLRMWLDTGLELANHTFSHADLHATSIAAYEQDIIRGSAVTGALMRERGLRPRYFRHPYLHTGRDLETKHEIEQFLGRRGYRVAPVTLDNEDYLFAAAYSLAAERGDADLMRRIGSAYIGHTARAFDYSEALSVTLFGRVIKQIVLLHANALNADYFGELAAMMRRRGYSFTSLDGALRDEAYGSADTYVAEDSANWLARWAVTKGVITLDRVLDDVPDVPDFVVDAAGVRK